MVTASYDKTARVWDTATGKPVTHEFEHEAPVEAAAFSPDGTRVVTASDDTVRVWNIASQTLAISPFKHKGRVTAVAFSADSSRIVARSDNIAHAWNVTTRKPTMIGHQGPIVVFSPDGTRAVITSKDNAARVWDVTTGAPVTPPLDHPEATRAMAPR